MHIAKVSEQGQVVIPAEIRQQLGIEPGSELDFSVEGRAIRVEVKGHDKPTRPEDGYGMLVCTKPGVRRSSTWPKPCGARRMIGLDTNILARFYDGH